MTFGKLTGCTVLLAALLVSMPLGCSKEADQSTPEATVRSFFEAMMDGDGERAASCIHGSDETKGFIRGMAGFMGAMKDFEEAVKAEWGDEGWAHFSDGSGGDMTIDADLDKLDEATFSIDGDKAVGTVPGDDDEIKLVRIDGNWYIDVEAEGDFPSGEEAAQASQMMGKLADLVREKQDRIGEEGVTAESLSQEFGMGMMGIMMGGMQPPN